MLLTVLAVLYVELRAERKRAELQQRLEEGLADAQNRAQEAADAAAWEILNLRVALDTHLASVHTS
jgi:hypothetical protein